MTAATTKRPLALADAQRIADDLIWLLEPFCDRIAVAGSVRRGKQLVSDIELVLIGKPQSGPVRGAATPGSDEIRLVLRSPAGEGYVQQTHRREQPHRLGLRGALRMVRRRCR